MPTREVQVAHDRARLLRQPGLVESPHLVAVEHRRGAEHLGDGDDAGTADADHADGDVVGIDGERRRAQRRREERSERGGAIGSDGFSLRPWFRRDRRQRGTRVSTVTNEGQSPSRHEKSLLHEVWWMRVLRPNSVSTGCTDRQLLISPQSPQPSQTRSLIDDAARPASVRGRACARGAAPPRTPGRGSGR